ncbi:MAG: hypothetical protein BHV99_04135 [Clostridium sp. 26_21]|nr:MAG: hypothetical protein BHV99_04135 [Clostridium sp. 26_21]
MKNEKGFIKVILMLIIIALIGILVFFGYAMYSEFTGEGTIILGNLEVTFPSNENREQINNSNLKIDNTIVDYTDNTLTGIKEYENRYLYKQLSSSEKLIYSKLYDNIEKLKTGTYKIEFGNAFKDILEQENGTNKLQEYYQTAIEAFTYDNPDIFFLDVTKMYINIETITKLFSTKYNVYITNAQDPTYLADYFKSKEQIDKCQKEIENIKEQILANIENESDFEKVKYIHDYLIDNIEYEQTFIEPNIYNIYGALVSKTCVCEGYAKALQYLLNEVELENVIVTGTATNNDGKTESHAWNYVKIDDEWYAIDTTWDDPIIVGGGKLTDKIKYRYFLKGSSTMSKNHFISAKFTADGQDFEVPKLSITDYNMEGVE